MRACATYLTRLWNCQALLNSSTDAKYACSCVYSTPLISKVTSGSRHWCVLSMYVCMCINIYHICVYSTPLISKVTSGSRHWCVEYVCMHVYKYIPHLRLFYSIDIDKSVYICIYICVCVYTVLRLKIASRCLLKRFANETLTRDVYMPELEKHVYA
jgi:hypothetical protein